MTAVTGTGRRWIASITESVAPDHVQHSPAFGVRQRSIVN